MFKEVPFSAESTPTNLSLSLLTPIYSLAFLPSVDSSYPTLVLGGGGGSSKTGASATLVLDKNPAYAIVRDEHLFAPGEDAPMSLSVSASTKALVCGVNAAEEEWEKGNKHLRVFDLVEAKEDSELKVVVRKEEKEVFKLPKAEDYQRSTAISPNGKLLAIGSTAGSFSVLSFPSLTPAFTLVSSSSSASDETFSSSEEVSSVDFSADSNLVLAMSPSKILVFSTESYKLVRKIPSPPLSPYNTSIRSARFGRGEMAAKLFVAVNATLTTGAGRKKKTDAKAFVSSWSLGGEEGEDSGWIMQKSRMVGRRPVTSFSISNDGHLLALGSADLSIALLSTQTLHAKVKILNAHEGFPSTSIGFDDSSKWAASASADGSVRVIGTVGGSGTGRWISILVALIILLLAVLMQFVLGDEVLQKGRGYLHL
ncbi:WD40 repeat-like protein [Atractiella rhizophila]|nr:WD40 repeat-like protein [Atractiella rhizophila]